MGCVSDNEKRSTVVWESAIRFSFGKHNTEEEVEKVVEELKSAVEKIRHSR